MTGFGPWTCGVASDRSTNWATTTARQMCFSCWPVPVSSSCYTHTSIGAQQYCHQFLEGNMLFFWTQNSFVTFFHFRIHFLLRFLPFFISGGVKVCQDILSQSCTRIFLALNSYEEIYHHCCCWRRRRDGWFLSLNSVSSYFAYIMCHHYITWLET